MMRDFIAFRYYAVAGVRLAKCDGTPTSFTIAPKVLNYGQLLVWLSARPGYHQQRRADLKKVDWIDYPPILTFISTSPGGRHCFSSHTINSTLPARFVFTLAFNFTTCTKSTDFS